MYTNISSLTFVGVGSSLSTERVRTPLEPGKATPLALDYGEAAVD